LNDITPYVKLLSDDAKVVVRALAKGLGNDVVRPPRNFRASYIELTNHLVATIFSVYYNGD